MRYSLGSTLANAFLCPYEKKWLDSYPVEFKSKFKPSFVMFQSRNYVKKFVDYINTKHPNVHFIFEIEDQNRFSFVDIKLTETLRKKAFETSVYRKSTFSGVLTILKCYFTVFQDALPAKSFKRKLSRSKKSLS